MITSELPAEIASTDEAFLSAVTPKRFKDITLEPYSLMRQVFATEICGDNAHMVRRVIVHIWICTLDEEAATLAVENPRRSLSTALRWAESHGVRHAGTPEMDELISIFKTLCDELLASTRLESSENGSELKNDGRQLG